MEEEERHLIDRNAVLKSRASAEDSARSALLEQAIEAEQQAAAALLHKNINNR